MVICHPCILQHIQMSFHFCHVKEKEMYTAALWLLHASCMKGLEGAADTYFGYFKFSHAFNQLAPNLSKIMWLNPALYFLKYIIIKHFILPVIQVPVFSQPEWGLFRALHIQVVNNPMCATYYFGHKLDI